MAGLIGRPLIPFRRVCDVATLSDRSNLGFAELQFRADLGLDEAVQEFAAGSPDGCTLLLAGSAGCIFGFLARFRTAASGMEAAGGIAFVTSVGSCLGSTFIGWTRQATGSFTGAVDALAALMLLAMVVLERRLPQPTKKRCHPFESSCDDPDRHQIGTTRATMDA